MRRASVLGSKSRITSCVATVGYVTGNVDELALFVAGWTRFGWCIGLQCVSTLRAFPGILHAFTSSFFILIIESFRPILARIFHESLAATMDIAVLPGVLGCRPLRRTVQVRLGTNTLRLPGGTPIFMVSRQQFMKYPGLVKEVVNLNDDLQNAVWY